MTTNDSPNTKRRWFQFSLRALLVLVLLVSVGMSWFAVRMEKARRQKEAVEAIRKAGGGVVYDYEPSEPLAPKWARALLGDDFFFDVFAVESWSGDFGDDEAIYLKRLTNLEVLFLKGAQITDAGLANIKELANLESVHLSDTQVTGSGIKHLQGITKLKSVDLGNTQVTDAGLERLAGLTNLIYLNLSSTQVTDAGLQHLRDMTSLEQLNLSDTEVTDAGLESVKGLTNLSELNLHDTEVTSKGIKELQKALPECVIFYWPNGS